MRKARWPVLLIVIGALAAAGVFFLVHRRQSGPGVAVTQAGTSQRGPAQPRPLRPHLVLEVDGSDQIELIQGTPLVLTVRVSNPRATNAAAGNRARQQRAEAIQGKVTRGELSADEAQSALVAARQVEPIEAVRAGTSERGWDTFLHFERQTTGGRAEPLKWPLSLVAAPVSKAVTLDDASTAELDYALPPDAAARVGAGTYQIVAVFEVAAGEKVPANHWRGRTASAPVKVNVTAPAAQADPAAEASTNLQRARFFEMTKDWTNALQCAQDALKEDPKLIRAQMIQGEAKEAQGDLAGARAAFSQALQLFYERYPDSYEPPEYLIYRLATLNERLGNRPPAPKR